MVNQGGLYALSVLDTNNCIFQSDTFEVVIDSFSVTFSLGNDTSLCLGNLIYANTPPGVMINSYLWGNSDVTPSTTVQSQGNFSVEVVNNNQCLARDTVFITSLGNAPTANFSVDTLCESQQAIFLDQSLPSGSTLNSWSWNFGDINQSSLPNPSTTFQNSGFYQVELQVGAVNGCFGDTTITVEVIQGPSANFSFDVICAGSSANLGDESFSNTANPVSSWFWDFGAGQTSITQVPSFTLSNEGNYPVKLIVSNEYGCYDTINKLVEIFPALLPDFEAEQICIGDTTLFTDITPSFSIIDRTWIFDFFGQTSTIQNPRFYYPNPGTYDVKLSLTNAIGCQSEVVKSIEIRDLPEVDLVYDNTCEDAESALFDASSTDSGFITSQTWIIDGEELAGDSVYYTFEDLGFNPVFLSVTDNFNCTNDTSILISVYPLPQVDFDFSPNYGEAPIAIQFENLSSADAVDFLWSFGENNSGSLDENPTYTYTQNGIYNITLVASNLYGCSDSLSREIPIIPTELDVELSSLSIQKTTLSDGSIRYTPRVLVKNVGSKAITTIDLLASIDSESKVAETLEGLLTIGQAFVYEFSSFFIVPNSYLVDYLCVEAANVNDNTEINFSNNKVCEIQNGLIQSYNLYPNPTQETVFMDVITTKQGQLKLDLYDLLGRTIFADKTISVQKGYNQISIDCRSLQAGEYLVRMIYQDEVYSQALIITNK